MMEDRSRYLIVENLPLLSSLFDSRFLILAPRSAPAGRVARLIPWRVRSGGAPRRNREPPSRKFATRNLPSCECRANLLRAPLAAAGRAAPVFARPKARPAAWHADFARQKNFAATASTRERRQRRWPGQCRISSTSRRWHRGLHSRDDYCCGLELYEYQPLRFTFTFYFYVLLLRFTHDARQKPRPNVDHAAASTPFP
jgi:hypothetical protein